MDANAEQLSELAEAFELATEATEQLLGEYALFVLEHEEVVDFLYTHLHALERDFGRALCQNDFAQVKRALDAVQLLFGEAQLKVNRSVVPLYEQVSNAALSKTHV